MHLTILLSLAVTSVLACSPKDGEGAAPEPTPAKQPDPKGEEKRPHASDPDLQERADALAKRIIIADGHVDVPYRLEEEWSDVTGATEDADFDYPRVAPARCVEMAQR